MTLDFPVVELENFEASAAHQGEVLVLKLRGSAEMQAVDGMEALLRRAHDQALLLGVRRVEVNLEHLQFMNSSCFKWFVTWLVSVQDLAAQKPYTIHFISNPRFRWQRASLKVLSCLAPDVVMAADVHPPV